MNNRMIKSVMPAGMTQVTRAVFWQHVMVEDRNIHPSHDEFQSRWYIQGTRELWGWLNRGWNGPFERETGTEPEIYALARVNKPNGTNA